MQAMGAERTAQALLQSMNMPGTASLSAPPPADFSPDYRVTTTYDTGPFQLVSSGRRMAMPAYFDIIGNPGQTLIGSYENRKITDADPTPCFSGHAVQDIRLEPPQGRSFLPLPADSSVKTDNLTYTEHWSLTGQAASVHRELTSHFDTPLCSGQVRTDTVAKALATIRDSFSDAVAVSTSVKPAQTAIPQEDPSTAVAGFAPPVDFPRRGRRPIPGMEKQCHLRREQHPGERADEQHGE